MRVTFAPDKFAGSLSSSEACEAMAEGWAALRPADELTQIPMSDGGPGFLDVLAAALPSPVWEAVDVTDPLGRPVIANVLRESDTVYVESAQAVGLHLLSATERDPERTGSAGLAPLLTRAVQTGARRVVVGLGGSATNDGGRGLIEAMQAREQAEPGLLAALREIDLVIATDVANPLLGPAGASAVYGPQKGASREAVARLEGRMLDWVAALPGLADVAGVPGAGAAGGIGAALLWLGGRCEPGAALVAAAAGLRPALQRSDLAVTGEGTYDATSLRGKVVGTIAAAAREAALPCVVIAGQVTVGRREAAAHGIDETVALVDLAGSAQSAMEEPARWVSAAAGEFAARWSPV